MILMILLLVVMLAAGTGAVLGANRLLRADHGHDSEPELGSEAWRTIDAEVVSVLRAGSRTFLQVRYKAGPSVILVDVLYPVQGDVPLVGHRIPIRYDPGAPARAVYDRHHARDAELMVPRRPLTR